MTQPDTNPLHALEAQIQRSDPHFARGLQTGRPRQPREYQRRRGPAWALLALSLAMLVMGMVLPQGLLLASGLVTAGVALYLLAPPYDLDRPDLPLRAPTHPHPGSDHQCLPGSGTKEDYRLPSVATRYAHPRCGRW
ncbi:DUF3040 domain-containing protein [Streptomyces sp. NPDC002896]|uniref:DUF3040 domain-containing protein n=1 Tax=Streptomyces sp. NPDC002896 TaxID=3154438 RepID=UPI0033261EE6